MDRLLGYLTTASPGSVASLEELANHVRVLATRFDRAFDRAVAGGFDSDRVAFAFGAGYEAALARLVPSADPSRLRVFCVTEEKGGHPKAIATRLTEGASGAWVLEGKKRWTTFGPLAHELLVVATVGADAQGRNRLRVARIDARREGVEVRAMPPTPFAPELPHAEVSFRGVVVAEGELLEGDGYERYVKPFRTIEDVHVLGAIVGHVAGLARAWTGPEAQSFFEDALGVLSALGALAPLDPLAAATHLALAGVLRTVRNLLDRVDETWTEGGSDSEAARSALLAWNRDRALMNVAETARELRRVAAWRTMIG
ncbi:MAG TPA: acyl-CoA dehydrogenase family protein [Polyangiaceae bacterium]|jgi:hypothetical protein